MHQTQFKMHPLALFFAFVLEQIGYDFAIKGKMPQKPRIKEPHLMQSKQDCFCHLAKGFGKGITLHQAGCAAQLCSKRSCFLRTVSLQWTPCQQRAIAKGTVHGFCQTKGREGSILHKSDSLTKFIAWIKKERNQVTMFSWDNGMRRVVQYNIITIRWRLLGEANSVEPNVNSWFIYLFISAVKQ